ncbi:excalibur calcium-binding domain-containing protein [Glycomyces albidus]|uniref:excalibur calcium-binding domain-containing protein n=1 Tax=Glycomyces albidus TaxID=2656774 RepID=UPI002AD43E6C|nr:excalibur calcium-binding domain-containing protein [Glycomyces albidus]
MSVNPPSPAGPDGAPTSFWTRFSAGQRIALVSSLSVVVICCAGLLIGNLADPESPDGTDVATETPTESPSEIEPTTRPEPTREPTTAAPTTEAATETEADDEGADEGDGASDVYYENCDAARDAGAAPVEEGDPGYGSHLDSDGDGVGCEDSSGGSGGGNDDNDDGGGGGNDDDDDGGSVYYDNCDAVRAAGADPIYAGDPGYGSHLDRDGDGVGCE